MSYHFNWKEYNMRRIWNDAAGNKHFQHHQQLSSSSSSSIRSGKYWDHQPHAMLLIVDIIHWALIAAQKLMAMNGEAYFLNIYADVRCTNNYNWCQHRSISLKVKHANTKCPEKKNTSDGMNEWKKHEMISIRMQTIGIVVDILHRSNFKFTDRAPG